jgi:hypothetical protein
MTTEEKQQPKFGIIQSRGLGDIILALPIARHYHDQGYKVVWPICSEFLSSVVTAANWVDWVPIKEDPQGAYFYDLPLYEIKLRGCDTFICLYQSLSNHPELVGRPYFQIQKFDEHKYTAAGVPFIKKWTLKDCITRDEYREKQLYERVVKQPLYYVTHLKGSSYSTMPDLSNIPKDWQRIDVDQHITESIFDWIKVIEGAQALIALDSVIANMVDQLQLDVDKYWIPRSHIHLTPVLGSAWTILDVPPNSIAAQAIFQPAK